MKGYLTLFVLLTIAAISCQKSGNGSNAPSIAFMSLEPNIVKAGSEDSINISFRVSDKDADLGSDDGDDIYDIYLFDSRRADTLNPNIYDTVKFDFPTIPPEAQNPGKGAEGICSIKLPAANLLLRDTLNARRKDTMFYEIYITDRARHTSNRIKTADIYIVDSL